MASHSLLIGGEWVAARAGETENVTSPFNGDIVGEVALARSADATLAIDAAVRGFDVWRRTPAHARFAILTRAAQLADERVEEMAQLMSRENGKSLVESRGEAGRSGDIIRLAAFEGSQLYGESLPLDANRGTGFDKIGFTIRQPVGVVVAISPFNYPALLVLHKIAPALAAGNAVVLKPARATPLTALAVAQCFLDAGLPAGVLNVITGGGSDIGDALVRDSRVRKISFTGSTVVGEHIASVAGGYINAGQVCISAQRIIVSESIVGDFLDALKPKVEAIRVGDPLADGINVGSLISRVEADRVMASITAAVSSGATLITGGQQDGTVITPTIVADVDPYSPFAQDELFGPAVAVSTARDLAHAIELANSTADGLGAGIFTNHLASSIRAIREIESGVVHVNWTQLWRADLMPYGGFKSSGIGKEGPRSAVDEMTEIKTVILHGTPWDN